MNPSLDRKLERLAREIAAAKMPKIDEAANKAFKNASESIYKLMASDCCFYGRDKGAAQASASGNALTAEKVEGPLPSPVVAQPYAKLADAASAVNGAALIGVKAESKFKAGDKFLVIDRCTEYEEQVATFKRYEASPKGGEDYLVCDCLSGMTNRVVKDVRFPPSWLKPIHQNSQPQNEWIEWSGGKCPVSGGTRVEVVSNTGPHTALAGDFWGSCWTWGPSAWTTQITAYRVLP